MALELSTALPSGPAAEGTRTEWDARLGSNGCIPERLVWLNPRLQQKVAFSRFPPVHRAGSRRRLHINYLMFQCLTI